MGYVTENELNADSNILACLLSSILCESYGFLQKYFSTTKKKVMGSAD